MIQNMYSTPEIVELEVFAEGVLAASNFTLNEYESNGDAIELEF